MKKILIAILSFLSWNVFFGLTTYNTYLDPGLVEKNGTFDLNRYLYSNYILGFISGATDNYFEAGAKLKVHYQPEMLKGFYANGEMMISNISARQVGGDAADWWGGNIPFFGETNFGFDSRWFDFQFGFQNLVSSTGIYHNLTLDDYSGSFLAYKSNLAITKYFDFQVIYNFVRIHQGPWYTGEATYDYDYLYDSIMLHRDEYGSLDFYQAKYGKSVYFHKINIRPAPWLRIGLQEATYFLGENLNPYLLNPFFIYFATAMIGNYLQDKTGTSYNLGGSDGKIGLDFSVGFDGWRFYGEAMIDDANGEYFKFQRPDHPDRVGFMVGGELRGYLFDKYLQLPRTIGYFVKHLYINLELVAVSRYTFSRDSNYNYEYVRDEFPYKYYPKIYATIKNPDGTPKYPDYMEYTAEMSKRINRVGNFIGYMYGSNSDSIDIAIGWRNDLYNVKDSKADYITDRYYESQKKNQRPDRLFKLQLHYHHYRLGEDRDVVLPFYMNEHFYYDLNPYEKVNDDGDKTARRTGFVDTVLEEGNTFDINVYTDLLRVNRFTLGLEAKTEFKWVTYLPRTAQESTDFTFKFDIGVVIGF